MGVALSCERCHTTESSSEVVSPAGEVHQINGPIHFSKESAEDQALQKPSQTLPDGRALDDFLLEEASDDEGGHGLRSGSKVKIVGMKSAVSLNDQVGVLQSFDATKQRWIVWLEADSKQVSVQFGNLILYERPVAEPSVKHVPLAPCHPLGPPAPMGPTASSFKDTNVEEADAGSFTGGDFVQIVDMQTASHLNGEVGCLAYFDPSCNRWTVVLAKDSQMVAAKSKNLIAQAKPISKVKPQGETKSQAQSPTENNRQRAYEQMGKATEDLGCKQQ